jgi:hypothetical protein
MKKNPLKEGIITENFKGIGTVTQWMIQERAAELAEINDHSTVDYAQQDWEQAKRELTGELEISPEDHLLSSIPESEREEVLSESYAVKAQTVNGDDENDDGQSDGERLVEEGMREAVHDQMLQGARRRQPNDE